MTLEFDTPAMVLKAYMLIFFAPVGNQLCWFWTNFFGKCSKRFKIRYVNQNGTSSMLAGKAEQRCKLEGMESNG